MKSFENIMIIDILLVEDNTGDIRLTKEVLKEGKISNTLNVVTDGEEALMYLMKEGKYSNAQSPDLILLDLNLPKIDGRQVLEQIKNHPKLKIIPVIVLTTSEAEQDVLKMYENHANCYITKPVDFEQFISVIRMIEDFWLTLVRLPKVK